MLRRAQLLPRSTLFLAGVLSALALLAGCGEDYPHNFQGNASTYRPECPVDSVLVQRDSGQSEFVAFKELSLPGNTTLVPEYHDCQKFPIGGGGVYGPLVAIFAREHLNSEINRLMQLASQGATKRAVGIGLILSFNGAYNPLGIRHAYNCLYMWATITGADTTRNAFLIPVSDQKRCLDDLAPTPSGAKQLEVRLRRDDPSYGIADYPEVARWDWDPMVHQQYISIGCLNAWCDIGNQSFNGSQDRDDPSLPTAARRVLRVKPWYDEQRLADFGPTNVIFASGIIGTLYPDPMLAQLGPGDYATHEWKKVAYSFLSEPSATYLNKLNFEAGHLTPAPKQVNQIELCQGTRGQCNVPATELIADCGNTTDPWWSRITSVSGVVRHRCVIRRTHSGVTIPGIVRWRWSENDERGWISCPGGCCEVVGKG
jgi:hypothetical protein